MYNSTVKYSVCEKSVDGFDYTVDTKGNIKNILTNKILKPQLGSNGYYHVTLYKNKKPYIKSVHRLVAEAFLPKIDGKNIVNHIDENRLNNNIENLEWCNHKHNNSCGNQHIKRRNATRQRMVKTKAINIETGEEIVKECYKDFKSMGFSPSKICLVLKGERKKHKGYIFEEVN